MQDPITEAAAVHNAYSNLRSPLIENYNMATMEFDRIMKEEVAEATSGLYPIPSRNGQRIVPPPNPSIPAPIPAQNEMAAI